MKLNLQLISKLSMTLAFWVLTNYSGWSQIMAMAQSNHKSERATTNELLLNNVLNEQKDRYHADFMFERKL